jgi:hypothetical protein
VKPGTSIQTLVSAEPAEAATHPTPTAKIGRTLNRTPGFCPGLATQAIQECLSLLGPVTRATDSRPVETTGRRAEDSAAPIKATSAGTVLAATIRLTRWRSRTRMDAALSQNLRI